MSNTDNYSTMAANGSTYEYGISLLPSKIKRPLLLTSFNFRSEPSFQGPSQRSTIQALAFRRVHDFVSNTGPPNPVYYGEATITVARHRMTSRLEAFDKAFNSAAHTEKPH